MDGPVDEPSNQRANFFIFTQASDTEYQDQEGSAYHYPLTIPNARKIRAGDRFVYYRPGSTENSRYFFGQGKVGQVIPGPNNDATALVQDYLPFKMPVARLALGAELRRSTQHSISLIGAPTFERLVATGMSETTQTTEWLYVLTASGPAARAHYAVTIAKPVNSELLAKYGKASDLPSTFTDVRAWGALPGPRNTVVWNQMKEGDWVITYWSRKYHDAMRVIAKFENEELAASLWGRDATSGETWRYMYLLTPPRSVEVDSSRAAEWLPSSYQGFTRISDARIRRIVERFGGIGPFVESHIGTDLVREAQPVPYLSFEEQVERVHEFMRGTGYVIDPSDLANFVTSLRVKPFVILAGISGIGKSRLVRVFAQAVGGECEVIPVQPNWTDSSDLFGYIDPARRELIPGRCTVALRHAEGLGAQPYFLCLDEMNLAHVEHYFADFLSVLESRRVGDLDRIISDDLLGNLRSQLSNESGLGAEIWPSLPFPNNAFVVGTVNMDETTHPFSRKVLDRANTIELTNVSLETVIPTKGTPVKTHFDWEFLLPSAVSLGDVYEEDANFFDGIIQELKKINAVLEPLNQHFAYRVRDEVCLYCYLARDLPTYLPMSKAMDYQVLQKVLPRIHGSTEATRHALANLFMLLTPGTNSIGPDNFDLAEALSDAGAARYPLSARKLALMLDRFQTDGFTSFWL